MQTGEVGVNLVTLNQRFQLPYLKDLIAQKQSGSEAEAIAAIDLAFHEREYQRLCQQLEDAIQTSTLPEEPFAKEALNDLLISIRLGSTNRS
jgi:hypothetical protein